MSVATQGTGPLARIAVAFARVLVATVLASGAAQAQNAATGGSWPANIGSKRLELPIPPGFAEVTTVVPALRPVGERLTPPTNRLLAYFVPDNVRESNVNDPNVLKRYFMIQTFRQAEAIEVQPADFAEMRAQLRGQYQKVLEDLSPKVQRHLDSASRDFDESSGGRVKNLKIGDVQGREIFLDEADAISLLAVAKVGVQTPEGTKETPLAMALTTSVVGRKIVYFYAYSRLDGDADLAWVKAQTVAWLGKARAANR